MQTLGPLQLALGPPRRGAPDSTRAVVDASVRPPRLTLASQQVSDPQVINALARIRADGTPGSVRVMVERDYLFERSPVALDEVWGAAGRNEANREALAALLRASVPVRFDHVRGELMHVNLVLSGEGDEESLTVTSANLSTSSLDRHLNWTLTIAEPTVARACRDAWEAAWDGDFRDVALDTTLTGVSGQFVMGARGEAGQCLTEALAQAEHSVDLAFFNIAESSAGAHALLAALDRGVNVTGVVDADQGNQSWDGVQALREAGADVRYYPGARTGAIGRMHYKMAVIDATASYLSTANLSASAESSLEAAVLIPDGGDLAHAMATEIERLKAGASRRPIPEMVI